MKTKRRKRGFTLTELAVVLAVLAIVVTMVVSFDALMHHRRAISQQRLDAMEDIKVAEALIEAQIEKTGDSQGIAFGSNGLTVGDATVVLERVTDVEIEIKRADSDKIYFCTITYMLPGRDDKTDTYTFCVDPSEVETIGGSEG